MIFRPNEVEGAFLLLFTLFDHEQTVVDFRRYPLAMDAVYLRYWCEGRGREDENCVEVEAEEMLIFDRVSLFASFEYLKFRTDSAFPF